MGTICIVFVAVSMGISRRGKKKLSRVETVYDTSHHWITPFKCVRYRWSLIVRISQRAGTRRDFSIVIILQCRGTVQKQCRTIIRYGFFWSTVAAYMWNSRLEQWDQAHNGCNHINCTPLLQGRESRGLLLQYSY